MTDRELMQMALDAMLHFPNDISDEMFESIRSLRARLAQPEQEPLAWWQPNEYKIEKSFSWHKKGGFIKPLYPAPPQREWQGLTDEEITWLWSLAVEAKLENMPRHFARMVEEKLKEKNT